jgi:hypothetical protein
MPNLPIAPLQRRGWIRSNSSLFMYGFTNPGSGRLVARLEAAALSSLSPRARAATRGRAPCAWGEPGAWWGSASRSWVITRLSMDWVTPSSTKSRACARTERCHDAIGSRHSCGRRRHTRTTCPSWAANLGQEWPTGLPTAQYASDSVWFSASSAGASTSRSICLARTYPFRRGTGFFGGAGIATVASTFEITAQDTSPPAPPGHKELPPPARAAMLMGATTSSEFVAVATTKRRPSSSPVPQCPLRTAPAHQLALSRRRRHSLCGRGDGAFQLGLDRDLPRSQRTRRRWAARASRILGAIRGMEPEGFATTLRSGILDARVVVGGRLEMVVDRWYHHLLVLLLVFLLSLHAHTLSKSRPAQFRSAPSS